MKLSIEQLKGLIEGGRLDRRGQNIVGKCPRCGESEFGISIQEGHRFGCYRQKNCGFSGNIFVLLKELGRLHEFLNEGSLYIRKETSVLENKIILQEKPLLEEMPDVQLPIGYKRITHADPYLMKRGWTNTELERYEVGETLIDPKLNRKYVIFPIREQNKIKGYVSRVKLDREEIEQIKKNTGFEYIRYINSETEFSRLLYGLEYITENTHTVILVEGCFDVVNIDKELELYTQEEIKPLGTFKCDLSPEQLYKIQQFTNIKNVILFYDPDVIKKIRIVSTEIENKFESVTVALSETDNDPGAMKCEEILDCLLKRKNVTEFNQSKIQKKELK